VIFNRNAFSLDDFYKLLLQAIIPRPIAWVLTQNPNGSFNIAPFSFFNGVASEPPILMISVGWKDETTRKDTWVNIEREGHFVVHIPPAAMAEAMVTTSKTLPHGESELESAGLSTLPVEGQALPRLVGPKVAMFCHRHKILEIGEERIGLILGEVDSIWVEESAVRQEEARTVFDSRVINPLTRLGGLEYGLLGEIKHLRRPR